MQVNIARSKIKILFESPTDAGLKTQFAGLSLSLCPDF